MTLCFTVYDNRNLLIIRELRSYTIGLLATILGPLPRLCSKTRRYQNAAMSRWMRIQLSYQVVSNNSIVLTALMIVCLMIPTPYPHHTHTIPTHYQHHTEDRTYRHLSDLSKEEGGGCTVCCLTKAADNPLGSNNIQVSICNTTDITTSTTIITTITITIITLDDTENR